MTTLFITRKFPPATGGMENFAYDLYMSLKTKATVRLIKWGGSQKYLPLIVPVFFVRACFILLTQDIDVIHAQDGVLAPLGYVLSRLFRKRYVVVIHGLDITYQNWLFRLLVPRFVRRADLVFCISHAAADEAMKRGVPVTRIRIIPLGITDELHSSRAEARKQLEKELQLESDTAVLLTVGRLVKRKGVAWFIDSVMPKLITTSKHLVYVVVGEGEQRAAIKAAIKRHKLDKHVRLLGKVEDEKMPMLYNGADVFVQPNVAVSGDIEGFGRVLLEASLCELSVVAAGIEGITEAVADGKNGLLVPSEDSEAFIAAITRLLHDTKYARQFGAQSRTYTLAHYRWDTIAHKYIQGYDAVLRV